MREVSSRGPALAAPGPLARRRAGAPERASPRRNEDEQGAAGDHARQAIGAQQGAPPDGTGVAGNLSVILCTYNRAARLARALRSRESVQLVARAARRRYGETLTS